MIIYSLNIVFKILTIKQDCHIQYCLDIYFKQNRKKN